ncbi:MAG TPA: Flp pilus assembly protein CpaB [Acidimicrobiales bacterium]|nr:Flp pilus assembly protein CpaB [Acidimicrobiales bacterium]
MSSRRTVILVAAIVVGALAALALLNYVRGIEDRANDNAERVKVFKIAEDIPKGTFGQDAFNQGFIVADEIPREFFPASAITDPADIADQVAISNLAANHVVVGDQFVPQAEALVSFSDLLEVADPDNPATQEVAITITVDQVKGVAGLLVPGDFVNIMVGGSSATDGAATDGVDPTAPAGGEGTYTTPHRYLYQKVQILAIGQQRVLAAGETVETDASGNQVTTSSGLVTFAVPPDAAQRIASVSGGSIYLTLVNRDYQPFPIGQLDLLEPLPGESTQLTPYGPDGKTGG